MIPAAAQDGRRWRLYSANVPAMAPGTFGRHKMIRKLLLLIPLSLSACAEPAPPPVDGEIVRAAVKHAQDKVDSEPRSQGRDSAESEG